MKKPTKKPDHIVVAGQKIQKTPDETVIAVRNQSWNKMVGQDIPNIDVLPADKMRDLISRFIPFMESAYSLVKDAEEMGLNVTEEDDVQGMQKAKEFKKSLAGIRKHCGEVKDEEKLGINQIGKTIDYMNRTVREYCKEHEARFDKMEKFAIYREKERRDKLVSERREILEPWVAYMDQRPTDDYLATTHGEEFAMYVQALRDKKIEQEELVRLRREKEEADRKLKEQENELLKVKVQKLEAAARARREEAAEEAREEYEAAVEFSRSTVNAGWKNEVGSSDLLAVVGLLEGIKVPASTEYPDFRTQLKIRVSMLQKWIEDNKPEDLR